MESEVIATDIKVTAVDTEVIATDIDQKREQRESAYISRKRMWRTPLEPSSYITYRCCMRIVYIGKVAIFDKGVVA
jgi:hypothetical protein